MPFYCFLTLFACGVTSIVLSVVLAGVKIRKDESLTKYRTAHWFLCAALLFYGLSNFFQISLEDAQEETLSGLLMITVGSLQAMMFTMVVLIFIRPAVVTLRNVSVQFTIIALLSAFLFFAHFTFLLHRSLCDTAGNIYLHLPEELQSVQEADDGLL